MPSFFAFFVIAEGFVGSFFVSLCYTMQQLTRHIFAALFLVLAFSASAKERRFYGRVTNEAGSGLPNAVVESKDRSHIYSANARGVFSFKTDPDSIDFFIFSAQGYDKKDFLVEDLPEDSIIIELTKTENNLRGAVIGAKGRKFMEATAGDRKAGYGSGCYLTIYDEIAVFLKADETDKGTLKEVGAYIGKGGIVDNEFRIHVYARDSATGLPGDDITDSALVVNAKRGHEWVRADLSDRYIQLKGGVFVSVEWIVGEKNDFFAWDIPTGTPNYYSGIDSLRPTFNGQVLGLTWQGTEPKVYRRYARNKYEHKDEGKWFLTPPLRGGQKRGSYIVPMVYYTYTYLGK